MYLGIHLKSLGLCILNLVMSKFRCISLWERAKYRTYVPEIIFVKFNSYRYDDVMLTYVSTGANIQIQ